MAAAGHLGPHDLGGCGGDEGPVDPRPAAVQQWEKEVDAVEHMLERSGALAVDELRRHIESMEPEEYRRASYYERWAFSLAQVSLAKGLLTEAQLRARLCGDERPHGPPLFQLGQAVRVGSEQLRTRWRKPHLRTPGYLFGKAGLVCLYAGEFADPEVGAFRGLLRGGDGAHEPPAHLYRVRFRQADLWEGYSGDPRDTVEVEIFEHWLSAAGPEAAARKRGRREEETDGHGRRHGEGEGHDDEDHDDEDHEDHHDHEDHGHRHEARAEVEQRAVDAEAPATALQRLAVALRQQLVANGHFTDEDVRLRVEAMDARGERLEGRRLVARAWLRPEFRELLLRDGNAAALQIGVNVAGVKLLAVANTPELHNVVVCTLCSCYPRALLGMPPSWYKSRSYRARAVEEPRAVLAEFGTALPPGVEVRVHDSTANLRYVVVPLRPEASLGVEDEDRLMDFVTRDAMIGVAR